MSCPGAPVLPFTGHGAGLFLWRLITVVMMMKIDENYQARVKSPGMSFINFYCCMVYTCLCLWV
jgi:hypothetical protein